MELTHRQMWFNGFGIELAVPCTAAGIIPLPMQGFDEALLARLLEIGNSPNFHRWLVPDEGIEDLADLVGILDDPQVILPMPERAGRDITHGLTFDQLLAVQDDLILLPPGWSRRPGFAGPNFSGRDCTGQSFVVTHMEIGAQVEPVYYVRLESDRSFTFPVSAEYIAEPGVTIDSL